MGIQFETSLFDDDVDATIDDFEMSCVDVLRECDLTGEAVER
jgi:hypothetical protein